MLTTSAFTVSLNQHLIFILPLPRLELFWTCWLMPAWPSTVPKQLRSWSSMGRVSSSFTNAMSKGQKMVPSFVFRVGMAHPFRSDWSHKFLTLEWFWVTQTLNFWLCATGFKRGSRFLINFKGGSSRQWVSVWTKRSNYGFNVSFPVWFTAPEPLCWLFRQFRCWIVHFSSSYDAFVVHQYISLTWLMPTS